MNKEEQRIAIAEACGWFHMNSCWHFPNGAKATADGGPDNVPDYLNDLNAMHEAEENIRHDHDSWGKYLVFLSRSAPECRVFSTAAQRAEAFLRTTGKWKEDA